MKIRYEDYFSIGSSSILQPGAVQLTTPRRTIFTDDTSGNLTGKSFSRSCSPAERRLSSPSTNSARSGRGGLSNIRLKRAETDLPLYEEIVFRGEARISHLGPIVVTTGKHTA